jgi:hypothetical protein
MAFLGHSLPEAILGTLAGLRSITVRSSRLAECLAQGVGSLQRQFCRRNLELSE